ncbi:MAG: type II toxin-antitoxin system RatA family toxin [Alphaproteobacteria bacterium]|nr:type II toxin-antitoxin system RatA family toxin [Alphaproteobacteria bacterium]
MPRLSEQVLIPHAADNLYDLVRDIRQYPQFIRWIERMKVMDEMDENGVYSCTGEVDVHFKGFDERFSTRVSANHANRRVDVTLLEGPFRHLRNRWHLDAVEPKRTRVHFYIDYEFRNPVLRLLARTNSRLAVDRIMTAFRSEADRRFGSPSG